jgi:P-type Cu+ transporter
VDESMLTGESIPVQKKHGDVLCGGTLVVESSAYLLVSATGDDSTLGRIVSSVQDAQSSRPPIQETADIIARWFVPVVSIISLISFVVWLAVGYLGFLPVEVIERESSASECYKSESHGSDYFFFAFVRGLSVWVSACPCAFGLATPTAVLVATGVAASNGLLFRKGAALQYLSEVDMVALDKVSKLYILTIKCMGLFLRIDFLYVS